MDRVASQRKKINVYQILGICLPVFMCGVGLGWLFEKKTIFQPNELPKKTNEVIPSNPSYGFSKPETLFEIPPLLVPISTTLEKKDPSEQALCIEVLSPDQKPMEGIEVIASTWPMGFSGLNEARFEPKGDLGILYGGLPYPDEVILGSSGSKNARSSDSELIRVKTDAQGMAEFLRLPAGNVQFSAASSGLFAKTVVKILAPPALEKGHCQAREGMHIVLSLEPSPFSGTFACRGSEILSEPPSEEFALERLDISIQTVDDQGQEIANVLVRAKAGKFETSCLTNSTGRCVLRKIPTGKVSILIDHPPLAPWTQVYDTHEFQEDSVLRLSLSMGSRIEGHIFDSNGGIIRSPIRLRWSFKGASFPVTIDQAGYFIIPSVPPGEITLRAEASGYVPLSKQFTIEKSSSVRELRIELGQAGRLRGKVRSLHNDSSLGVKIWVRNERGESVGNAITDSLGEFFIKDLPPGNLFIEADTGTSTKSAQIQIYPDHEQWVELEVQ